jgi:hypothetical protein
MEHQLGPLDPKRLTPGATFQILTAVSDSMKRKILIILSNRLNRAQKSKFLELDCDPEGNILKEQPLRAQPREPKYHEVWENDEGRSEFASCHRFKRRYGHKLQRPKSVAK